MWGKVKEEDNHLRTTSGVRSHDPLKRVGGGSTNKRRTADFAPVTDFVRVSVFFGEKSVGGRR